MVYLHPNLTFSHYKWREKADDMWTTTTTTKSAAGQPPQLSLGPCEETKEQGLLSHQPPVYNGRLWWTFQSHTVLEYVPITT